MRSRRAAATAFLAVTVLLLTAAVAMAAVTYKGRARSAVGDFQYGKVTVVRDGSRVTRIKIESVTASCSFGSGLRIIVFNPRDRGQKILGGSGRIRNGKMSVLYLTDKTVEDQRTGINLKFSGSRVTGTFSETGPCTDKGRLTARR